MFTKTTIAVAHRIGRIRRHRATNDVMRVILFPIREKQEKRQLSKIASISSNLYS